MLPPLHFLSFHFSWLLPCSVPFSERVLFAVIVGGWYHANTVALHTSNFLFLLLMGKKGGMIKFTLREEISRCL